MTNRGLINLARPLICRGEVYEVEVPVSWNIYTIGSIIVAWKIRRVPFDV